MGWKSKCKVDKPNIDLSPHLPSGLRPFGECPFQGGTSSFPFADVNLYMFVIFGVWKYLCHCSFNFNSPLIELATHIGASSGALIQSGCRVLLPLEDEPHTHHI